MRDQLYEKVVRLGHHPPRRRRAGDPRRRGGGAAGVRRLLPPASDRGAAGPGRAGRFPDLAGPGRRRDRSGGGRRGTGGPAAVAAAAARERRAVLGRVRGVRRPGPGGAAGHDHPQAAQRHRPVRGVGARRGRRGAACPDRQPAGVDERLHPGHHGVRGGHGAGGRGRGAAVRVRGDRPGRAADRAGAGGPSASGPCWSCRATGTRGSTGSPPPPGCTRSSTPPRR
jgi:hypothetical protein